MKLNYFFLLYESSFGVITKKSFLPQGYEGFLSLLFSGLLKFLSQLWWPLIAKGLLIQETTPLGFMLYTIQKTTAGFTLHSPRDGGSHRPWACDPSYSAIRLWIMETTFHKLVRAIKALSRHDGATCGLLVYSTFRSRWLPLSSVPC